MPNTQAKYPDAATQHFSIVCLSMLHDQFVWMLIVCPAGCAALAVYFFQLQHHYQAFV
ncbi:hypothetical protein [Zooshikella harenae]|uniref:Uncharacterized protein n=1 Tax=Zooshikella harenae TaxID=2827238 RepID=A0ABS5ZBS8_9GAMM|nr:hypothetical protein [Zooshikella harenae]MBU2711512.1 hypothetical protein [Zooshikella harenae]